MLHRFRFINFFLNKLCIFLNNKTLEWTNLSFESKNGKLILYGNRSAGLRGAKKDFPNLFLKLRQSFWMERYLPWKSRTSLITKRRDYGTRRHQIPQNDSRGAKNKSCGARSQKIRKILFLRFFYLFYAIFSKINFSPCTKWILTNKH